MISAGWRRWLREVANEKVKTNGRARPRVAKCSHCSHPRWLDSSRCKRCLFDGRLWMRAYKGSRRWSGKGRKPVEVRCGLAKRGFK